MSTQSGRQREATEIARHKKAAEVGRLILGELDGRMAAISAEEYIRKPRRELTFLRDSIRASLRGEIAKFCRNNFENVEPEDLAKLYDLIFQHGSDWFLPLAVFERDFGKFRRGVLKGAPLHATIHISPWGLRTEYPEQHLVKDMAVSLNEGIETENRLALYKGMPWREAKKQEARCEIARLVKRRDVSGRMCILSCFNLIEAFINGIAWDYVQTHNISSLSKDNCNVLTESERPVSLITKLIRIPAFVTSRNAGPLHQTREPLKAFIEIVKPYRDAIVHASPFAAPEKFGGYDKLSKLYELSLDTVRRAVDVTIALVKEVHGFVDGSDDLPEWFLKRAEDGTFVIPVA